MHSYAYHVSPARSWTAILALHEACCYSLVSSSGADLASGQGFEVPRKRLEYSKLERGNTSSQDNYTQAIDVWSVGGGPSGHAPPFSDFGVAITAMREDAYMQSSWACCRKLEKAIWIVGHSSQERRLPSHVKALCRLSDTSVSLRIVFSIVREPCVPLALAGQGHASHCLQIIGISQPLYSNVCSQRFCQKC